MELPGRHWSRSLPLDSDAEDQLVLLRNVELAILLGKAGETNLLTLLVTILEDVFLGTLEDDTTLFLLSLCNVTRQQGAQIKL